MSTTAEVAKTISTCPVWQLPDAGKGNSPKDLPDAKQGDPGAAQKMRGTVIKKCLMLCCRGQTLCLFPVLTARGFLIEER